MGKALKHKDMQQLNINSSMIAGIIDNLRGQLSVLEKGKTYTACGCLPFVPRCPRSWPDIKADKQGQREYEIQLEKLGKRKEEAQERLAKNYKFATQFDRDIGPFEQKYSTLTKDIHALYGNAKKEHQEGIDLLVWKAPPRVFAATLACVLILCAYPCRCKSLRTIQNSSGGMTRSLRCPSSPSSSTICRSIVPYLMEKLPSNPRYRFPATPHAF